MHKTLIHVLVIHDEKPGHLSQLSGLSRALEEQAKVKLKKLEAKNSSTLDSNFIPDIVIGAGHATHTTILRIARKFKAFSVVLMKPSIPHYFFDAIICPEHDKIKDSHRVFKTMGTINKVSPEQDSSVERDLHLMLLGGPSKNYHWDENKLIEQIVSVCRYSLNTEWQIIPSRRTPESIRKKLTLEKLPNLQYCDNDHLTSSLDKMLLSSRMTWVTPDSQSMLYEALTAGSATGLFDLPLNKRKKSVRIDQQTHKLFKKRLATDFKEWSKLQEALPPISQALIYPSKPPYFCEADNAAKWLLEKFFMSDKKTKHDKSQDQQTQ